MKRTESKESNDFKKVVKGRQIILSYLAYPLSPFPQCFPQRDILSHIVERLLMCQDQNQPKSSLPIKKKKNKTKTNKQKITTIAVDIKLLPSMGVKLIVSECAI